jgi:signal transduction histidine kinase
MRLAVRGSLSGRCVMERETLICLDSEFDDRVDAAACQRIGVRSMAVVPLFRAGQAVGALKVTSAAANRFGPEDVQALQLMAGLVATALAQAQAFTHVESLVGELDARREFLTAVLESTQAGIVACDERGRLTLFNGTTRSWHGVDVDARLDPEGWSAAYDLFEPDGVTLLPAARIPLVQALRDGQVTDAEIVIAPHGRAATTRVLCQGRRLQVGDRVLGAVVVMHDITAAHERELALALARDEALAGTRAKTAFLAAASHEIRTPLNGVLGTLELLDVAGLDPQQRQYVEVARRSSESLLSLLNDVLDLSKAEASRVVLKDAPFSPNEVAADVAAALAPMAQRKGLQLHVQPGTDRLLTGDADRLRQVLMNLVGNAVKFTSAGHVTITTSVQPVPSADPQAVDRRSRRLSFAVSDSGAGIAGDELQRVFQPFEQGEQGQRFGGTGLGLALSQELTDLMGGRLTVDSTLGSGSTFTLTVTLPGHEPRAARAAEPVRRSSDRPAAVQTVDGGPPRRLRVLVADDVEVNRMVARALLVAEGADVVCVDDGDEAVLALQSQHFDLVLLDNRMPRMSGIDAACAIRALAGPAGRTRLVALTASASDEDRAAFQRAGMQSVLLKPVRGRDLRAALHAV